MLITRSLAENGNLLPKAFNVISSIPEELLFHFGHEKLHPASAYRKSIRAISEQFTVVLDQLDNLHFEHNWIGKETALPSVIKENQELLYRLNEHFDACYSVLRSLCPLDRTKPTKLDTQFLSNAKLPGWKSFMGAIQNYRDEHVGLLVNKLKHDQAELNWIYFRSPYEFRPGYFLRDVLQNGGTGPNPKLHSNGKTAFSFTRDLKLHIWWLYRISDLLADEIKTITHVLHQHEPSDLPVSVANIELGKVVRRVGGLRPEFFPDEMAKPYPRIIVPEDVSAISLEFPTSARGLRFMGEVRVCTQARFDSNHRYVGLPYFGGQ